MQKFYRKGYRYEREIVNQAIKDGCISFRSAGSHSPIDVCIIDKIRKEIFFIQAKNSKYKYQKLKEDFTEMSEGWKVFFEVRVK